MGGDLQKRNDEKWVKWVITECPENGTGNERCPTVDWRKGGTWSAGLHLMPVNCYILM